MEETHRYPPRGSGTRQPQHLRAYAASSRPTHRRGRTLMLQGLALAIALIGTGLAMPAHGNTLPEGGTVVSGNASISGSGNTLNVNTQGPRTAIDWQRFNIGSGNTVVITQPDGKSVTVNRVVGNDASHIFGVLNSNGKVVLLNPAGIWFGPNARINTSALLAGAGSVGDAQMAQFAEGGKLDVQLRGLVRNEGEITVATGGYVALLGAQVDNAGVIRARQGNVMLATGPQATLDFSGDGLVNIAIGGTPAPDGIDPALSGGVAHTGQIDVAEGVVVMSAARAAQHLDSVINLGGKVAADSVSSKGGVIVLGNADRTRVSGELSASGAQSGTITVLGQEIEVASTARLDANGRTGNGGQILVGGNIQGKGSEPHAQAVNVAHGAQLAANGADQGGVVIVWSDGKTVFAGRATAAGGNSGGLVETSGKTLGVAAGAEVNVSGGKTAGAWLLDPKTINIVASSDGSANTADISEVDVSTIVNSLRTGNVLVLASDQINVNTAIIARDTGNHTLALVAAGIGKV